MDGRYYRVKMKFQKIIFLPNRGKKSNFVALSPPPGNRVKEKCLMRNCAATEDNDELHGAVTWERDVLPVQPNILFYPVPVRVRVCACACVRARVRVRACACASVRLCVRACLCVRT